MKRQQTKDRPYHRPSKLSKPDDNDDRLTPDQMRRIDFGIAQGKVGLTYGPFEGVEKSLKSLMNARESTRRISSRIPSVLFTYLKTEAKRLGMGVGELMATILETHRFADSDEQLIMRAIAHSEPRKNRVVSNSKSGNRRPPEKRKVLQQK